MISSIEKYKRKKFIKFLSNSSPNKFVKMGEKKVIPALRKLAAISPAYRNVLSNSGCDINTINSIEEFQQKVPILNKKNFFTKYPIDKLLGKHMSSFKLTMTSSGFSNAFAYGFLSDKALRDSKLGVDTTFDYWFNISERKTFFLNCMPMGLHVDTSLPIAEVSVRSDMAIALLKKIAPHYEQTIIVADAHFMKKLAEEGVAAGINWGKLNVNVITGQDWLPENLRTYLANILEIDIEQNNQRGIFATMGMTEIGLNVFHESYYTVNLRRTMMKDTNLKKNFTNHPIQAPPSIFHYYPFRTYIEQNPTGNNDELLFTSLNNDALLPMVRYTTGDSGSTHSYESAENILTPVYPHLIPDLKLPLGLIYGRTKKTNTPDDKYLKPEDIKEGMYADHENASQITGLLGIAYDKEVPEIRIHLKKGVNSTGNLVTNMHDAIVKYVPNDFTVKLVDYAEFPNAMTLDYERKFAVR